MKKAMRSTAIARFVGAFSVLWLGSGSAWAGGGGPDLGTLQATLDSLCTVLAPSSTSCPQLPTITQAVLEISGLESAAPEVVRFEGGVSPTSAINAVNPPAGFPVVLSNVAPLAFLSAPGGVAFAKQPGDPDANSFFYAATNGAFDFPPFMINLVYDYPPLTNPSFAIHQVVADLSIPLAILNSNGTETEAPTTIHMEGASNCQGAVPCLAITAIGSFGKVDPTKLGLTVTLAFQPSANSVTPHAVITVQAPLLVTQAHDPAYFQTVPANPAQLIAPAFVNNELGVTPKFLGLPIGVAPYAAPQCPGGGTCAAAPPPSHFPFCARIARDDGTLLSAVAAFFSIGTAGTTYVSAPLTPPSSVTCPF